MTARLLTVCFLLLLGVSAPLSWAERVWDSELKRYLTEQEMMHAEVYLTEDNAVKLMFPNSDRIRKEIVTLRPDQKAQIETRIGWKFPEETFEVYIGETGSALDGYAMIQNTIGKHKPMTYMVGVDPNGQCTNVELLVFREARGSEVRTKRFNAQYEGKTVSDPIRINRDILNISGATMSVRSMSAGVKRVLVLIDELYLKPLGRGRDQAAGKRSAKAFFDFLFSD